MSDQILAFDLGTGGVKASVYNEMGDSVAESFVSYDTYYPQSGYHEQKPNEWWQAVITSTRNLFLKPGVDPKKVICLAVSGHSLGVIPIWS